MLRILCVVGARPNFIKMAPLMKEMAKYPGRFQPILINTGQHYQRDMVDLFFEDLEIPQPDEDLDVGSGSHAEQTARIMTAFEPICLKYRPDLVLVVGDVNSTMACALVAVKLGIRVAHVEAGLRSFDRAMPEEINREVTDLLSDYLFTTCEDANQNLLRAGVDPKRIFFVGNVMIDSLQDNLPRARQRPVLKKFDLAPQQYGLITLHRPSNVDDPVVFSGLLDAFEHIQKRIKLLFPAHPRTVKNFHQLGLAARIEALPNLVILPPQGYLDFLCLMENARLILTDSGGLQEETSILGVPCLTLRENTERPITIQLGTNELVGTNPAKIIACFEKVFSASSHRTVRIPLWDGQASKRLVQVLLSLPNRE